MSENRTPQIYEGDGDRLMASLDADRVTLLPSDNHRSAERIRIMWGHPMLPDILAGRYRTVVCGVNARDNAKGIIAQIVDLLPASQWSAKTVTNHARTFAESILERGGAGDETATGVKEPFVLKYDLDTIEVFAMLRPLSRDHFTLKDLTRGFKQVAQMLEGRRARHPVASVSFLGARSNRLIDPATGEEPTLEAVLAAMYKSGFRGDVYPPSDLWHAGQVGVFPSYPFPTALDRMREGGH